jgi:hypothetical protein
VREWPLRVKASLLACTIFTALLIINMTMGREGKNFPDIQDGTYSSTTAREFHTVPF